MALAAGNNFTCALLADGSVVCWGDNSRGQLGIGSTVNVGTSPGQMGSNLAPADLGPGHLPSNPVIFPQPSRLLCIHSMALDILSFNPLPDVSFLVRCSTLFRKKNSLGILVRLNGIGAASIVLSTVRFYTTMIILRAIHGPLTFNAVRLSLNLQCSDFVFSFRK